MKYEIEATMYFEATLNAFAESKEIAIDHVKNANIRFDISDYIDNTPKSIDINVITNEYQCDEINIESIELDESLNDENAEKLTYKVNILQDINGKFTVYADSLSSALEYLKNAKPQVKIFKYQTIDSHIRMYDVLMIEGKYFLEPSSAKEVLESE